MGYKVPDSWPLPHNIGWYRCCVCGMLYGDGEFDQPLLNLYYLHYYGYGRNPVDVSERLASIADYITKEYPPTVRVVDFGGSGGDGKSIVCERLISQGYENAHNVNAGEPVPACDILLASHVLEHVYDMDEVMKKITVALAQDGLLIVDGPDSTGLILKWRMPMLDFHTKHIDHFRFIDYLRLMERYGFEVIDSTRYISTDSSQLGSCLHMYFRRFSTADASMKHIVANIAERVEKLRFLGDLPVNVWGLADMTWHLLSQVKLNVINYIDNDPAYRGVTYDGKPVQERPLNSEPIVVMAQAQRGKLIANIRKMGIENKIIEI